MVTNIIPSVAIGELVILLVLVIIGVIVIFVLKALIHFILPIVAAVVVWLLTRSLLFGGVAFLAVAVLQLVVRRR